MATCLVQLRDGDTLAILQSEYGIPARSIVEANNVAWSNDAIDAWVMSVGGRRLAYDARQPYDTARQLGWAVFTDASQIQLPADGPRPCVGAAPAVSSSSGWGWLAFGGLFAGGAYFLTRKKKG